MGGLSPYHLLLILLVVLIFVGPGKLPEAGAAIGKSIREFRRSMGDIQEPPAQQAQQAQPVATAPAPAAAPQPAYPAYPAQYPPQPAAYPAYPAQYPPQPAPYAAAPAAAAPVPAAPAAVMPAAAISDLSSGEGI